MVLLIQQRLKSSNNLPQLDVIFPNRIELHQI